MRIREGVIFITVRLAAELPVNADFITRTAEIRFAEAQNTHQSVRLRVSGTDCNGAGLLFGYINFHDDIVRILFALEKTNIDIFKITGVIDAFNTAAGKIFIEYVTLLETQFTTNNAIFCFLIAYNKDLFYMSFADADVEDPLFIHIDSRYMAEDVSLIGVETVQFINILTDNRRIENISGLYMQGFNKLFRFNGIISLNIDAFDDGIHFHFIIQGDPFGNRRKNGFNGCKKAGRAEHIEVMTNIVGFDGITRTHSQTGQELLFQFRHGQRADGYSRHRFTGYGRSLFIGQGIAVRKRRFFFL